MSKTVGIWLLVIELLFAIFLGYMIFIGEGDFVWVICLFITGFAMGSLVPAVLWGRQL